MHYVYARYSNVDHKFYIGYTANLRRRILEHHDGKVRSTKVREGLSLIFYEAFISEVDARRRERYFKSSKGRATLKLMLRDTLSY